MNPEAKVISAVCKNGDIGLLFTDGVEELFTTHRDIWEDIRDYHFRYGSVPDISEVVKRHGDFEPAEVKNVTAFYVDELRDYYTKTRIREMLLDKGRKLDTTSGAELLEQIYAEATKLGRMTNVVRDLDLTDHEAAARYFEAQAKRAEEMGGSPGIPTGFKGIDLAYPTGMAPGHLIVVIGWSGRGKTWFASYLACKAWNQGHKPMIVSLEMSPEQMRDRIYTIMGSGLFRNSDFQSGAVNIDQFQGWAKKHFDKKNNFVIVSSEGTERVTPATVQAKIDQHRPDIVILDYQQLFDDSSGAKGMVEQNRNISRDFKRMAVSNGIPIVNLAQATFDDVSDTEVPPMIEQVAWSKGIQQDADLAIAVHKPIDVDMFEIVCRKTRHGSEFSFYIDWNINQGIIKEIYQ